MSPLGLAGYIAAIWGKMAGGQPFQPVLVLASTWAWAGDVSENHAHREGTAETGENHAHREGTAETVSIDQRRRAPHWRRTSSEREVRSVRCGIAGCGKQTWLLVLEGGRAVA